MPSMINSNIKHNFLSHIKWEYRFISVIKGIPWTENLFFRSIMGYKERERVLLLHSQDPAFHSMSGECGLIFSSDQVLSKYAAGKFCQKLIPPGTIYGDTIETFTSPDIIIKGMQFK